MTRTGQLELVLGLERAKERASVWTQLAERWLRMQQLSGGDVLFTAEDLRAQVSDPPGSGNALGATIKTWADKGYIEAVGGKRASRPGSHGRRLTVWRVR